MDETIPQLVALKRGRRVHLHVGGKFEVRPRGLLSSSEGSAARRSWTRLPLLITTVGHMRSLRSALLSALQVVTKTPDDSNNTLHRQSWAVFDLGM